MTKKPTLKDVAREAEISVGMAGRVLGGYGYFSEETKQRVLEAAEKLEYRPNAIARSLKSQHTKAIGLLISNIVSVFWPTIVRAIEDVASKAGYHVILCNTDEDPTKEQEYLSTLYERNVDGLIVSPSPRVHSFLKKISQGGIPLVLVDRTVHGLHVPSITVDNEAGAYEAVRYLIEKGHKRIGVITGLTGIMTSDHRFAGYKRALQEYDIPMDEELIRVGDFRKDRAFESTEKLLSLSNPPTALFVSNETMAMGAMLALTENKIPIPEEMSIIGFGDPDWAPITNPPLSTVRQPTYAMGTIACENLLRRIKAVEDHASDETVCMKPELIIRGSC